MLGASSDCVGHVQEVVSDVFGRSSDCVGHVQEVVSDAFGGSSGCVGHVQEVLSFKSSRESQHLSNPRNTFGGRSVVGTARMCSAPCLVLGGISGQSIRELRWFQEPLDLHAVICLVTLAVQ